MQYLARREYSRAELHAKLQPFAQQGDNLNAVLDELAKRNWLSDARAAKQWVQAKRDRFGSRRVAHELRRRGISEELIAQVLSELKTSELETARKVWQRKFGKLPQDAKEKARQMRFLQSRGFSIEVILTVLKSADTTQVDED